MTNGIIYLMGLELPLGGIIIWVKKTQFSKTEACLFIYHCLLCDRHISKKYLEEILNIQSRITLYNYIEEIRNYFSNFDFYLSYIMEIYYDADKKEYILDLRKKG